MSDTMLDLPPAYPHGHLQELFTDVFFVTGTMVAELEGSVWQFSRNMTVLRDGSDLTLVNTVRLDDAGLASLDSLGTVKNIVRIGDLHGADDAFYLGRYKPDYWGLPGMTKKNAACPDRLLEPGSPSPVKDSSLFIFETTNRPEAIVRLDREGGIMIACDSLMNWTSVDQYFSSESAELMQQAGFIKQANCGPLWMKVSEPQRSDFERLREIPFEHALCGHGVPLLHSASGVFQQTFQRLFGT